MNRFHWIKVGLIASSLFVGGTALAVDSADTSTTDAADAMSNTRHEWVGPDHQQPMERPMAGKMGHWRHHGGMKRHQGWMRLLGLTPEQRSKITELHEQSRAAHQKLHDEMRANRMALMTTAPTDPSYAALVTKSKQLAAEKIQAKQDLKIKIYREVLTDEQRTFAQALMKHEAVVMANRAAMGPHGAKPMKGPQGE